MENWEVRQRGMAWDISKNINFCYGHRVWTQVTNDEFALGRPPKCRHLHGHEGLIEVHLSGSKLNEQGMVTDFCNLGWLKKWIDDTLDHKFIIDRNDPGFMNLIGHNKVNLRSCIVPETGLVAGAKLILDDLELKDHEREILEGYFVVDFVPTSENLSKWMFEIVQSKMKSLGVTVSKIVWWETPKSRAEYSLT